MSFSPIAFTIPNYRDYSDWWLKAYESGTTTPKNIALDSEGSVLVAKVQLNSDGFTVSAGSALVIPYINDTYDLWLFPTETEADANDTSNALQFADNIQPAATLGDAGNLPANTVADMVTRDLKLNTTIDTLGYYSVNDAGAASYIIVAGGTGTADGGSYIDLDNGLQAELIIKEKVHAAQFGAVSGDFSTVESSQNAAIAAAIATRKDVEFSKGVYWLDGPIVVDLGTQDGSGFWEGTGYGQKLLCNRTTFAARSDFTGTELVELAAPDSAISGWVNFQCRGFADYGCLMTGAQTAIESSSRAYDYRVAGVYINGRYGQQVGPCYGSPGAGAQAVIKANDNTGINIESPQCFRTGTSHFLCYFEQTYAFTVTGGSPDKCDEGLFCDQSQGVFLDVNLEGTKRPMFFRRSWIEVKGRAQALGGLALSPENSTDGVNLDIGDATTRRSGTSLINGDSARVRVTSLIGTNWDFENDLDFSDFSGSNSNELYLGQLQLKEVNFLNCILPTTMTINGSSPTELQLTNSTVYDVKGNGSGDNQIVPNTEISKTGFDISFDGTWYIVQATGLYEIELVCDITQGATPANTVRFDVLQKNSGSVVYSSSAIEIPTSPNGVPCIVKHQENLGVGNGLRIQGVTDALSNIANLNNLTLKIKRIGNI